MDRASKAPRFGSSRDNPRGPRPVDASWFAHRRRRAGALIALAAIAIAAAGLAYLHLSAGSPSPSTFGGPEKGVSLAVVHIAGKTAYFPGVVCESTDPELITSSLGLRDDPISFFMAAFLGPQGSDGSYVSPVTSLLLGHRPGIAFDQNGSGSISVSSELRAALRIPRQSSVINVGSLSFRGKDISGAQLVGSVSCL